MTNEFNGASWWIFVIYSARACHLLKLECYFNTPKNRWFFVHIPLFTSSIVLHVQKYVCPTFPSGLFICSIRRTGNTLDHSKSKLRTMCSQQWRCRHVLITPIGTPCLGVGHYKPIPSTCGMKPSMGNVTINNFKWIYDFLNCGILSTDNLRPRDLIYVVAYRKVSSALPSVLNIAKTDSGTLRLKFGA